MRKPSALNHRWEASCSVIAGLIAAMPIATHATGFAGTPTVASGSATFSSSGTTQTVTLANTQTIINWAPTDTATSTAPINFLSAGQTVTYTPQSVDFTYTVLNRILPTDATRAIGINGTITSANNVRTWFYTPGGFLIGSGAVFNVGGLVLTAADPVTTTNPLTSAVTFVTPSGTADQFSVAGVAGSQGAITIQAGAQINVATTGRSAYMVAIAPQINNAGTINVKGSTALVAAESASFTVDPSGLFTITVSSGSTVSNNTFVNTGSVGGSDSQVNGAAQVRRVYMVAIPKNDAITMAISSSGTVGFATAGAAAMDGNEIVLSAGENVTDTGTGNPTNGQATGIGTASLTVGAGSYSSNLYAVSSGSATVTDPANAISFLSNLSLVAPQSTVNAAAGTINVAGNLSLIADNTGLGSGEQASVNVASGAALTVGSNATALAVNGNLLVSANDTLGGLGGFAQIAVSGGTLNVAGNASLGATGSWANASENSNTGGNTTTGGTAQVMASTGGTITVGGQLALNVAADATNAGTAYFTSSAQPDTAINALGGSARVTATGTGSLITATGGLTAVANATGGSDGTVANGGIATGGTVGFDADTGGSLQTGINGQLVASATATGASASNGNGGAALGGSISVIANNGTVATQGAAVINLVASATGGVGTNTNSAIGGAATGGTALIQTEGSSGTIVSNTVIPATSSSAATLDVSAQGGSIAETGGGGAATGGTATIAVTGAGQSIALNGIPVLSLLTMAQGGAGFGGGGGAATGGTARLNVTGGSFVTSGLGNLEAAATGGGDYAGAGGAAAGGNVLIDVNAGGSLQTNGGVLLAANANGGTSNYAAGGNALGGNVLIDAVNPGTFDFHPATGGIAVDTSSTGGTGSMAGTTASAGGARLRTTGSFTVDGPLAIVGNTSLVIEAAGNIAVTGTITGTGAGAYLQLWADNTGAGTGTVTLAGNAINLTGTGAAVDIDYNPVSLGTPTNYAPGVAAGTLTAYQLVDNVTQLQEIGGYLSQNFALGKNIDASATQGWNNGAGFIPIGTAATPFTGNFDGLGHTIAGLTINFPTVDNVGLFGMIDSSAKAVVIRNVGLIDTRISGHNDVGGLIGDVAYVTCASCATLFVKNTYVDGTIVGASTVGGLIGLVDISSGAGAMIADSHTDASVTATAAGLGGNVGGLVGQASFTGLTNTFATGPVIAQNGMGNVGGLVGTLDSSTLTNAYATGAVTAGANSYYVGGLVGMAGTGSQLTVVYATGTVTAGSFSSEVGGLVGVNNGTISQAWSSGLVSIAGGTAVGGLAGLNNGTITNAYWDTFTSGQAVGIGSDQGTTNYLLPVTSDPTQNSAANYALNTTAYGNLNAGNWVYDQGVTRPMGAWEVPVAQYLVATVDSAHQVQLIDQNPAGSYVLTQNIDMTGTNQQSDIWAGQGFIPIADNSTFTGTIEGGGHVLSNIVFNTSAYEVAGLVAFNGGLISDLGLWNATLLSPIGTVADAGLIAGQNEVDGTILDSFATGTINALYAAAGGLVGVNAGTINQSYASVTISGAQLAGGLVGSNSGTVTGVFANGAVSGSQAGGLFGYTNAPEGAITNAYWDSQLSGQASACSALSALYCTGATGLTTAQTRQASNFAGFLIDTTGGQGLPWRMYQGSTSPLLEAFLQPITVQPQSLTEVYNAAIPNLGVTTYGASGSLLLGTAQLAGLTRNAGTNTITYAGGLYSNQIGYDLVTSATLGVLTITPAPLSVVYTANAATSIYGNTNPTLTGLVGVQGLQGSDTQGAVLGGTAQFTTSASAQSNVGQYGVTGSGLSLISTNYTASYFQQDSNATALSITARPIDVTAQPVTRPFGESNPALTYTVTGLNGAGGLVNGDQLTGVLATSATTASAAGKYAITQGTLAASSNYTVAYIGSDLTVSLSLDSVDATITSVDTSIPGSSGGDGAAGQDPKRRRRLRDSVIASLRGALLPTWVPSKLFDDSYVTRPRNVDEPVSINGDSTLWTARTQP